MCAKTHPPSRQKEYRNNKARHEYIIEETLEAGIVLTGTEVKAIRAGRIQISDAFARIERGRIILYHMHIGEYAFGNIHNHQPYRARELLLKKKQIHKLEQATHSGGRVMVPLRLYFKKALVKVEIALATGKKHYDKRQHLKKKIALREAERAIKRSVSGSNRA